MTFSFTSCRRAFKRSYINFYFGNNLLKALHIPEVFLKNHIESTSSKYFHKISQTGSKTAFEFQNLFLTSQKPCQTGIKSYKSQKWVVL